MCGHGSRGSSSGAVMEREDREAEWEVWEEIQRQEWERWEERRRREEEEVGSEGHGGTPTWLEEWEREKQSAGGWEDTRVHLRNGSNVADTSIQSQSQLPTTVINDPKDDDDDDDLTTPVQQVDTAEHHHHQTHWTTMSHGLQSHDANDQDTTRHATTCHRRHDMPPPVDDVEGHMSFLKKQHVMEMEAFLRSQSEVKAEFDKMLLQKLNSRKHNKKD